jgi:hypothetical protein
MEGRGINANRFAPDFSQQVQLTSMMARHNMPQILAAEFFGVSQATVSRVWRRIAPTLAVVLGMQEQPVSGAGAGRVLLVDTTFVPTGNRPGQGRDVEKANYSGKHHVQCLNIPAAGTTDGDLLAVSEPVPGSRHDWRACTWPAGTPSAKRSSRPPTPRTSPPRRSHPARRPKEPCARPRTRSSTNLSRPSDQSSNTQSDTSRNRRSSPPATADARPTYPTSSKPSPDPSSTAPDSKHDE